MDFLSKFMLLNDYLFFKIADTSISAIMTIDGCWKVEVHDALTRESKIALWTQEEFTAVMVLCIGGDEIPGSVDFYKIAESAVQGWPNNLRPIP